MAELTNEFSWSKSRDEVFRRCPRQYYFHYYGSWGGWKADCDERRRKIYVLKQLKSRQMWAGSKVHDCIKRALQNLRLVIDPMPEREAVDATLAVMRKDYMNSLRGDYWRNPKTCGFFEHEYGLDLPRSAWKETADHVVHCLRTFYRSDVFGMIRTLPPDRWLDMEDFSSFRLDTGADAGIGAGSEGQGGTAPARAAGAGRGVIKINVVLDFSYRDKNDGVVIYDWKTGRSESERNEIQLACYSFYATEKWGVPPDRVRTIEFNLSSGRKAPYRLESGGLAAIREYIAASIRDMKVLLADPERNRAVEERFTFTRNEGACNFCNFRKVCPRWEES